MNGIESILKLLHYFEIAGKILNTFLVCCMLCNGIIESLCNLRVFINIHATAENYSCAPKKCSLF